MDYAIDVSKTSLVIMSLQVLEHSASVYTKLQCLHAPFPDVLLLLLFFG